MSKKSTKLKRMKRRYDINAFLQVAYDKLVNRVNGYGHKVYEGMSLISRQDFVEWGKGQGRLYVLFHEWSRQGFTRGSTPSIDRIDVTQGYLIDNMRWLTVSENSRLNWQGRRTT